MKKRWNTITRYKSKQKYKRNVYNNAVQVIPNRMPPKRNRKKCVPLLSPSHCCSDKKIRETEKSTSRHHNAYSFTSSQQPDTTNPNIQVTFHHHNHSNKEQHCYKPNPNHQREPDTRYTIPTHILLTKSYTLSHLSNTTTNCPILCIHTYIKVTSIPRLQNPAKIIQILRKIKN